MTLPNDEIEKYQFLSGGNCAGLLGDNVYDSNVNLFTARKQVPVPRITFPATNVKAVVFRAYFDRPVDRASLYLIRTVNVPDGKLNPVSLVLATGLPCIEEPAAAAFNVLPPLGMADGGMIATVSGPQLFTSIVIAGNVPAGGAVPISWDVRILADRIGTCCTITVTKGQFLVP